MSKSCLEMNNYTKVLQELKEEGYEIENLGVIGLIKPNKENFPTIGDRILASQHNVIIKLLTFIKIKEPSQEVDEDSLSKLFEKLKIDEKPKIKNPMNRKIWYLRDPRDKKFEEKSNE